MSSAPTAERLKKVMRIALVGVRPADQVLLKGYLRVLLRLEADLEWVSANSPQVDLFMINREFQQADSVKKLLNEQPYTPALYIDRDEFDQGRLAGNVLTLPLKEVDVLNQWLFANVQFLRTNGDNQSPFSSNQTAKPATPPTTPQTQTQPQVQPQVQPQTLDQILANRNQTNPQPAPTQAPQPTPAQTSSPVVNKNNLIDTLKTIQKRQDSIFALKQADKIIAYINPKFQRVWVVDTNAHLNTAWELIATNEKPPIVSQTPIDLVQWLWEKNAITPTPVTALIQAGQRYRITSWLKPLDDDNRHDNLKIQGVLESRDSTIDEIIQLAQVNRDLALRSVSGLIVSGLMTPAVYNSLIVTASPTVSATSAPTPQPHLSAQPQAMPSAPAMPAPTATMPQISTPTVAQNAGQDDSMKGFLSKLRRKLGL